MPVKITDAPFAELTIGGVEIGIKRMLAFEWKAFANGGYVIRGRVSDPWFHEIKRIILGEQSAAGYAGSSTPYLKQGRRGPVEIVFKIGWHGKKHGLETKKRVAYISDLECFGDFTHGQFEFVAVDPPSWLLNQGNGNGKVYRGKISDVIKKCVKEYAPEIDVQVTETNDDTNGSWGMMRMDPQRFIQSLLDWSVDTVKSKQTHWIANAIGEEGGPKLVIKQQHDLKPLGRHYGHFTVSINHAELNDCWDYSLLTNNFLTTYQTKLVTQGISSVSGKFVDKKVEPDKVEIKDDNTGDKLKPNIDSRQGFFKPSKDNATSIICVPEHSGGEVGIKYEDYMGGRPKNMFLTMLPSVMRMRIKVNGDKQFDDTLSLGVSTLKINWKDLDGKDYFLSGRWIIYGFHHEITRKYWYTNLYLYRIDHNANAQAI